MDPDLERADRRPPTPSYAECHLREDPTGVGAAVVGSSFEHGVNASPLHVGRDGKVRD
jgi:hypothetical protein